jgi:hypothetical protein
MLAIPVMYRTCSILGQAMFDITRQYTEIKLSYPCPKFAKTKINYSGSRHRKVSGTNDHRRCQRMNLPITRPPQNLHCNTTKIK